MVSICSTLHRSTLFPSTLFALTLLSNLLSICLSKLAHTTEDDEIALAVLRETDIAYRAEIGKWYVKDQRLTNSSEFCHVTNLPPASWHDFRLRAHNQVGYSEWSLCSDKVRTDDAPYLVTKDPRSITLRWTAQNRAEKYEMQMQEPSFPDNTWANVSSSILQSQYTVTNLFPANQYRFRIRAFYPKKRDHAGFVVKGVESGWTSYEGSAVSQYIQTDDALPDKFDAPILVCAEIYSLSIQWNLPIVNGQSCGNGKPLHRYEIQQMQWSVDEFAKKKKTKKMPKEATKPPSKPHTTESGKESDEGGDEGGAGGEGKETKKMPKEATKPPSKPHTNGSGKESDEGGAGGAGKEVCAAPEDVEDVDLNALHMKWVTLERSYAPLDDSDGVKPLPAYGPIFRSLKLRPGIQYKYRVRGENAVGWSPWTDSSAPMLTLSSIPDTPLPPLGTLFEQIYKKIQKRSVLHISSPHKNQNQNEKETSLLSLASLFSYSSQNSLSC